MAQIAPVVQEALTRFLNAVQRDMKVDAAYLFGSIARGQSGPDSDVDIAVVSEAFRAMQRVDTIEWLIAKTRGLGVDLQPIGFSPEEMNDSENSFARTIVTEGISLL